MAEGGENTIDGQTTYSLECDVTLDFYCDFCKDDGKNVEAEGFCVTCEEYLCEECYKAHTRNSRMRSHRLLDKDEMPKETPLPSVRNNKKIDTECNFHAGELVNYYCKNHEVLICNTCCLTGHRHCADFESILMKSENILDGKAYTNVIKTLESLDTKTRSTIAKARTHITNTEQWHAEVIKSVKLLKDNIIEILDKLEQDIVTEADTLMSEEKRKMDTILKNCNMVTESIETILANFEGLQSSRRVCQLYISMKESSKQINILQDKIHEADDFAIRTLKFEPSRTFEDLIENPPTLGKISSEAQAVSDIHQAEVNKQDPMKIPPTLGEVSSQTNISVDVKVEHLADIPVAPWLSFSDHHIVGSAVISYNRLIVVDEDAKTVILLDTETKKVISKLVLSAIPGDVTALSRNKAAVVFCDSHKLLILNISDKLDRDWKIETVDDVCHILSATYFQDGLIVLQYTNPPNSNLDYNMCFDLRPKLEMVDLYGNVVKRIVDERRGYHVFQRPRCVCISKDGKTIYVSDIVSHKVTSLTFDGEVKSVYSDSELRGPQGVCVDHHGNVYVCGRESRNVHMLTADLSKIKVILTQADGLESHARSMSHCQETNRLYVGMNGKVKVFQLA